MKNTFSWMLWTAFTLALLLTTRNPIYLILVTFCLLILGQSIAAHNSKPAWLRGNLRFLLTMVLISAIINTLFVHTGDSVIFSLPENWLLIGGKLTLESLVYGLINGLIIGSLYLTFNILNLALNIKQMTSLIPAALKPIAMTVTVALTFFPSIQQRAREIKEAQIIRGNPMKRVGDWLPLIIPLLVISLEKAFLLAESMTARGFHTPKASTANEVLLIGMVLGTFTIFSGWILQLFDYSWAISISLYAFGALVFGFVFWHSQRSNTTTRYHHEGWPKQDVIGSSLFFLASITLFVLSSTNKISTFSFSPYPIIKLPCFQWVGLALGLLPLFPIIFYSHD